MWMLLHRQNYSKQNICPRFSPSWLSFLRLFFPSYFSKFTSTSKILSYHVGLDPFWHVSREDKKKFHQNRHVSTIFLSRPHNPKKVKWKKSPSVPTSPISTSPIISQHLSKTVHVWSISRTFQKKNLNLLLVVELFSTC